MEELRREWESVFIDDRTVDDDTVSCYRAHRILRDECAVYLFRASLQEGIKRRTDRTFVFDALFCILLQRGVVVSDCFMVRFEVELWHAGILANTTGCVNGELEMVRKYSCQNQDTQD